MALINDELLNTLQTEVTSVQTDTNAALISSDDSDKLINEIINDNRDFTPATALAAVCIICQKGGTSRRAQGNIYAVVNGRRLDLKKIRDTIERARIKFTLRQWARTNASAIHRVASLFNVPGDLYKKILRKYPEISNEDSFWLSNFQMDNEECPINLRRYIMEHFKELFPNSTKML